MELRMPQPIEPEPRASLPEDIRIAPIQPRPAMAAAAPEPVRQPEPAPMLEESFIPPMPERSVVRPTRMPRVEDLPIPAQNQINAQRGAQAAPLPPSAAEQKRMSLMQRLASVGFGRKEEEPAVRPTERSGLPSHCNTVPARLRRAGICLVENLNHSSSIEIIRAAQKPVTERKKA